MNKVKKHPISTGHMTSLIDDDIKRVNKPKIKHESKIITQNHHQLLANKKEEVRKTIFFFNFYLNIYLSLD